jgi:hypothetical protein
MARGDWAKDDPEKTIFFKYFKEVNLPPILFNSKSAAIQ